MNGTDENKKTYRDTRYGCLVEVILAVLFLGLLVHSLLTVIRNLP